MDRNMYSNIYDNAKSNNIPLNVTLELTTSCNWNCRHCYIPNHNDKGLRKEKIFNIFSQLRELGTFDLTFTGGEIFIRKDTMEIIKKAREMFFNVTLLTNISVLDEKKIKQLKKLYISQISCTIFSLDKKKNDDITQTKGSLKRVFENINLIKMYNIPLEVKVIVTNETHTEFKEVMSFCKKNQLDFKVDYEIFYKSNGNCSTKNLMITKKQLEDVLDDLDKIKGFKIQDHKDDDFACPDLRNTLAIDCKGNVFPCNKIFYKIGDVNKNTLNELWNNSKELNRIKNIKWRDLSECRKCTINKYCFRCPGIALLENKNILGASTLSCEISKIRNKINKNINI